MLYKNIQQASLSVCFALKAPLHFAESNGRVVNSFLRKESFSLRVFILRTLTLVCVLRP